MSKKNLDAAFAINDRVTHVKFGDGVVTGAYSDNLVVDFDRVGIKRVISTFLTRTAPTSPDELDARKKKAAEAARQHLDEIDRQTRATELKAGDVFRKQRAFKRPPADNHAYKSGRVVWWFARQDDIPEAYGWHVAAIGEIVATQTLGDLVTGNVIRFTDGVRMVVQPDQVNAQTSDR